MLNKVILMGRLTADPEVRQTPNNISVCRFTVAVDRPYRKDAERQADFIRVNVWRQTAEFVGKYFTKGKMVIVEGSLRNNDYTDANGVKHYSMEVQADNVSFGESKGASGGGNYGGDYAGNSNFKAPVQEAPKTAAPAQGGDVVEIGNMGDFEEIYSDGDLPF